MGLHGDAQDDLVLLDHEPGDVSLVRLPRDESQE